MDYLVCLHILQTYKNTCLDLHVELLMSSSSSFFEYLTWFCCFKGYELTEVQDILHAHYGYCMKYYIDVLVDKSLVYTSHGTESCNDTITMHDMIAEEIVQQESMTKPGERRRLWSLEDVREVLGYNTVSETHEWFDLVF